jgi:hypothetical protein
MRAVTRVYVECHSIPIKIAHDVEKQDLRSCIKSRVSRFHACLAEVHEIRTKGGASSVVGSGLLLMANTNGPFELSRVP